MRILVTGGKGTVGQVLAHFLRRAGHEVWTCDLSHHHDALHVRCDVAEYRQISGLMERQPFELVYHLAAEYGRWNGEDYYEQLWRTNVIGTKHLIRLQERLGFRMVFTSTSEVYGDVDETMSEDLLDRKEVRQLNDYALSKWVNEQQILNSAAMNGTQTVRVRLFNVYGPGEFFTPYRSAVCRFVYSALMGLPYTVFLNHQRTSLFVSDAVQTLMALVDTFSPGEVFNIGGTQSHDMKQVSDLILGVLGKDDSQVTYENAEPFTTRNKRLNTAKTIAGLGHSPAVPLEVGIRRTIEWMRRIYLDELDANPNRYLEFVK